MTEKPRVLPVQLIAYRKQARIFLERILDIERVGREVRQSTRAAYFFDQPLDTALFHFELVPASFGIIRNSDCREILYPNSIRDLIDFSLRECIKQEIPVRRCRSCGKDFPITGREVSSLAKFKEWLKDS